MGAHRTLQIHPATGAGYIATLLRKARQRRIKQPSWTVWSASGLGCKLLLLMLLLMLLLLLLLLLLWRCVVVAAAAACGLWLVVVQRACFPDLPVLDGVDGGTALSCMYRRTCTRVPVQKKACDIILTNTAYVLPAGIQLKISLERRRLQAIRLLHHFVR